MGETGDAKSCNTRTKMNATDPKTKDTVLIIGAGPTGLILAILLKMHGVSCRLIEKLEKHGETSRSFTIHARTMEMFDRIGLSGAFLRDTILNEGFIFNFKGKEVKPTLNFTKIDSAHTYIVIQSQSHTEKLLLDHLYEKHGLAPEWSTELIGLEEGDRNGPSVTLKHRGDGAEETMQPRWVVGCDGAHSFARKACGLSYTGSHYEGMVMQLMDAPVHGFNESEKLIHYFVSKSSFLLLVKLPGPNYRVIISNIGAGDPKLSQRELFQQVMDSHIEGVSIGEGPWATKWTVYKRLAERYRNGSVFFAGDSCHIHSPAGGQGMNVGLQDAENLAWKLALVIKGKAKETLLDTYELERKPVGRQVIEGTDAMHNIIMAHGKGLQDRLEKTQQPGWHETAVNRISGLSYHYRECGTLPDTLQLPGIFRAGDRAPDVSLPGGGRLFDILETSRLTMLLVAHDIGLAGESARALIESRFGEDLIKIVEVKKEDGPFVQGYGCGGEDFGCLIRPDGYISVRCLLADLEEVVTYLESWLTPLTSS